MSELRIGLIFSAAFHAVLAGVAVVGIPSMKRDLPQVPQPIPIDVIIAEEIRVTDPAPARQREKPTPAPPEEAQPKASAPSPARREAVPRPDAKPLKKKALRETPKEKPRVIPRVVPKSKPRPPSALNAGRLAALIDRSKKEKSAPLVEPKDDPRKLAKAVRTAALDARVARVATATLVAAIRRKVEECWSMPAGAKRAEDLLVRLKIYLTIEGELARPVEFMDLDRMHEPGQEYFRTAVESAARALRRCAPYELPKDKFNLWRVIEFSFDPRDMVGG